MENLEIIVQVLYAISLNHQLIEKVIKRIFKSNSNEKRLGRKKKKQRHRK
ncbi:hypothetical protein SAMN05421857_1343 [Chryseobacterium formosense]|nr:hypothetical protein [Chryseobacterium formosense]SFT53408.1 hypothetical protein SAMN05421857_1343 [Chryseobacterium formosense]